MIAGVTPMKMTIGRDSLTAQPSAEERRERNLKRTQLVLLAWQLSGLAGILAYCAALAGTDTGFLRPAATSSLLAGGLMFAGFVIGFLFGIPKTRQEQSAPNITGTTVPEAAQGVSPNTNLEQISDWLTKVLVGVGLTQIEKIGDGLWHFARSFRSALGAPEAAEPFVVGLVLYFVLCGFLSGYFWTRLFLAGAFVLADQDLAVIRSAAAEAKGEAESARDLAEAALAQTSSTISARDDEPSDIRLRSLIERYNQIRDEMKPGDKRTFEMNQIVAEMIRVVPSAREFNILDALRSSDGGSRLAAYARLYAQPEPDLVQELVESVTSVEEKPFGQVWGLRAIAKVGEYVKQPPESAVGMLRNFATRTPVGTDRHAELQRALSVLTRTSGSRAG